MCSCMQGAPPLHTYASHTFDISRKFRAAAPGGGALGGTGTRPRPPATRRSPATV